MNVRHILEYALQREREGFRFFSDKAASAAHASVRAAFERLAAEERAHIAFVERQISRLGGEAPASEPGDEAGFFSARAASEMIDQTTLEAMVPDLPVLRMAWLIERDLAQYYGDAAARAEGDARLALEKLAAWEREHERFFKELHDRAFAEYAEMPWGG